MEDMAPDTRQRILQSAYRLIYRSGFARVSVEAIAEGAGVTKRTLYYHFESKDDIAAEMLRIHHDLLMRQFRQWIRPSSATPAALVTDLFQALSSWADQPGFLGSGFSRLSAELADMRGHPARRAAADHKAKVERWLEQELELRGATGPKALSGTIMTLIEGSMSLALIHGEPAYIQAAGRAAQRLLPPAL